MKIINKLEELGVELTDEQKESIAKKIGEDVISALEHEKKIGKVETERDNYKKRAETAEGTLKGFDGKSLEEITKERDDWKEKFEQAEKDYNSKLEAREKEDLLKEAFAGVKFTSEAAKRTIMAQVAEGVSVKNGRLIGFNDLLDEAKKSDASAFVDEKAQKLEENKAKFTTRQKNSSGEGLTKDQIMAMKDPSERQKAIKEHIELFQKGE